MECLLKILPIPEIGQFIKYYRCFYTRIMCLFISIFMVEGWGCLVILIFFIREEIKLEFKLDFDLSFIFSLIFILL